MTATTSAAGWTPHQILIAVPGGRASRDGYISAALPGLGVHRTRDLGWIVTHLASGAAVLAGCPTRKYAENAARAFAQAADWTQPIEALRYRGELQALAQSFADAWDKWVRSPGVEPLPGAKGRAMKADRDAHDHDFGRPGGG